MAGEHQVEVIEWVVCQEMESITRARLERRRPGLPNNSASDLTGHLMARLRFYALARHVGAPSSEGSIWEEEEACSTEPQLSYGRENLRPHGSHHLSQPLDVPLPPEECPQVQCCPLAGNGAGMIPDQDAGGGEDVHPAVAHVRLPRHLRAMEPAPGLEVRPELSRKRPGLGFVGPGERVEVKEGPSAVAPLVNEEGPGGERVSTKGGAGDMSACGGGARRLTSATRSRGSSESRCCSPEAKRALCFRD